MAGVGSCVARAFEFTRLANAGRLLLFHHDPAQSDADLDRLGAHARELWAEAEVHPEVASEGMRFGL